MNALSIAQTLLLADSAVTTVANTRIAAVAAPQQWAMVRPQIILHQISNRDIPTLLGAGKYYRTIVQTDCNGDNPGQAIDLGDAAIECLNGVIKATVGAATDVDSLLGETDFTEFDDLSGSYRRVIQFAIWWRLGS